MPHESIMEAVEMQESEFNSALLDSIDQTLTDVFSPEVKEMLYRYLETKVGIVRRALPSRLDGLGSVLSTLFGPKGNSVLERTIAKRLYSKIGLRFIEKPSYTLPNYVEDAKTQLPTHSEVSAQEKQDPECT